MSALQLCIDFYEKSHGITNRNITQEQYNVLSQIQSKLSLCDTSIPVCEKEQWESISNENSYCPDALPTVSNILNSLNNLLYFDFIKCTVEVYEIIKTLSGHKFELSESNYDKLKEIY